MDEREARITVGAGAADYARTVRYMAALAYEAAHGYWSSYGDPRYGAGATARTMWAAEVLHMMMNEGLSKEAAELEAEERCEPGSAPEHLLSHARRVRSEEERLMSWQIAVRMYAETLAELWSAHKDDHSGQSHTADDLIEIYKRDPDNPERKDLIEWFPGSEEELQEVLHRCQDYRS